MINLITIIKLELPKKPIIFKLAFVPDIYYIEYSIIRQLHLQQKSVGFRIVGLSNNFQMA